jgi:Holliday junction DNA helicase RuvA
VFESIQGRVSAKEPTRVVVEAGGIGYAIQVPLSDHERLPSVGGDVRLLLHLEIREDAWRLFGFLSAEEREAFRGLLRVKNVGPQTAMGLLSGLGWKELARAIAEGDAAVLTRVKGVGRKTADLVIAELKEDARKGRLGPPAAGGPSVPEGGPQADAIRALVALGMEAAEARRRVTALIPKVGALAPVADVVRAALRG